jgi:hypothetical protein
VPLPFAFGFMGVSYPTGATLHVSSNGSLSFTNAVNPALSTDYTSSCPLPDPLHGAALFPLWQDLASTDAAQPVEGIFTSVSGSAPFRTLAIEWRMHQHGIGVAGDVHFEVRLYETTGRIEFAYPAVNGAGATAAVGIQQGSLAGEATNTFECHAPVPPITANKFEVFTPGTPFIDGPAEVGQQLTAGSGSFTGSPAPTTGLTWQRCDGSGVSCADILGATGTAYTVSPLDLGHELRVVATASNAAGSTNTISDTTAAVQPIPPPRRLIQWARRQAR